MLGEPSTPDSMGHGTRFSAPVQPESHVSPRKSVQATRRRLLIHHRHQGLLGKDRDTTFQISNVGSIENRPADRNVRQHCRIERLVWTQSAMVTGPLFTVGAASVEDGPLTFTITWQKGAIDDGLADSIVCTFQDLLRRTIEVE